MVTIDTVVSEEKSFEIVDGRRRRTTEPSHPISSRGAFGSGELKTTEANLTELHRKIEHNKEVCRAQELGSYAHGHGHNHVKGQIRRNFTER